MSSHNSALRSSLPLPQINDMQEVTTKNFLCGVILSISASMTHVAAVTMCGNLQTLISLAQLAGFPCPPYGPTREFKTLVGGEGVEKQNAESVEEVFLTAL